MDEVGEEFAPDKDAPPTTAAEDAALLEACDKDIEGEPTLSGKEAKLQQWMLLEQIAVRNGRPINRHATTSEHRCTRSQTIKVNIIKRNNTELTETSGERAKRKRGRKRNRTAKSLAKRDSRNAYPRNIGEHLLAENIGEHLFAKTENWNNREVEGKRTWGYKGMRVGEASHPGPVTEDIHETFEERINNRFNSEVLEKMQDLSASHENWVLDDLDKRGASTGMRVATNNFERKLYASKANVEEAIEKMIKLEIDVLVATEPGQASIYNEEMIKTVAREFGFDVKIIKRSRDGTQGGIAIIINERWAKIPSVVTEYNPEEENLKGRLMSIEFDNKKEGQHNKIQIIGAHLINSAHAHMSEAKRLLTWIISEKDKFKTANPMATGILIGDLNAAENEYLDTDREEVAHDSEGMELDAAIIASIRDMGYADIIRTRFPKKRVVTRTSKTQTNRLLDRVMSTKEVAKHGATRIGVYKHGFIKAGSDHQLVIADLPVDTAGAAGERVPLWEPYEFTKWSAKKFKSEKEEMAATEAYNTMLSATSAQEKDDIVWTQLAARACLLEPRKLQYPRKPNHKAHYTKEDWRTHGNLQALRSMRMQLLADAIEGTDNAERVISRAKRKIGKDTVIPPERYKEIWKMAEKKEWQELSEACTLVMGVMEAHLSKKARYERALQMRKNLKVRKGEVRGPR